MLRHQVLNVLPEPKSWAIQIARTKSRMKVELIPVIELAYQEEESHFIQPHPDNTYWTNSENWEEKYESLKQNNGYQDYRRILKGYPFYRINQFDSKDDMRKIIRIHLGQVEGEKGTPLSESCSLFGGYVLKVDNRTVFTPQCCSGLADIWTWNTIIKDKFTEGYICAEGHPAPKVTREGEALNFTFENEGEEFIPPAIATTINRGEMAAAIKLCQKELDAFGEFLNSLAPEFGCPEIATALIYNAE